MKDKLTETTMELMMGPSHPAMHGTVLCRLLLEGEKVKDCDVELGYLHRGFEKICENCSWLQIFPYTDRLNYASPLLNEVGYALSIEKLMGIEAPPRAQYIRVILGELSRITDHLLCNAAISMELGAFTPYLYLITAREWIFRLLEKTTGARVTHNWIRIGGVKEDLPYDFKDDIEEVFKKIDRAIKDSEAILMKNRIFLDRLEGVGKISKESAISYGLTGVLLRSTGIPYDVRKDYPYLVYEEFEFDIPIGTNGDNYDRFMIRFEEIRQSIRIIRQALKKIPKGAVKVEDWGIVLPDKIEVYTTIEGTIAQFMHVIKGIRVPKGEVYSYIEGGNGELGYYVVSTGDNGPYRLHLRAPCFLNLQALKEMVVDGYLADIIPTFGSINMIGGECDR